MAIPAGHVSNVREIITLQGHILEQQAHHPEATGTLSWILSALSISAKMIASQVRRPNMSFVRSRLSNIVIPDAKKYAAQAEMP